MKYLIIQKSCIFSRINAAEMYSFFESFLNLMPIPEGGQEGCPMLGIASAELETFKEHIALLADLVRVSRTCEESLEMPVVDEQRDQLLSYLINSISTKRRSPIPEEKAAATSLYFVVKPCRGMQRKPNEQVSTLINSLLYDLAKEEEPEKLELLGLTEAVAKLKEVNDRYTELAARRISFWSSLKQQGTVREIRETLQRDYDYITCMAQAKYMIDRSDEATRFIERLNALIERTKTNYKRRVAAQPKRRRTKEEPKA